MRKIWWKRALVGLVVGGVLACGGGRESEPGPGDEATPARTEPAEPGTGSEPGVDGVPTETWLGERALAEVDAVFPHSEHRSVDCLRCHTRPASHVTHLEAQCTACHRRPAILATLPERSARECATCHHEVHADRACTSCHARDEEGPRPVLLAIHVAGASQPRVHSVMFSHAIHAARQCRQCHTEPVLRHFGGDCSICHQDHHRPEAECTNCHEAAGLAVHTTTDVHDGCGGSGCHQDATVLGLRPTRNVCLTCHTDKVEHMPGRECQTCHAIARERLGGDGGGDR